MDPEVFALECACGGATVTYRVHHWRHVEAWRAPASESRPGCLRVWPLRCVWRRTCRFCRQAGACPRNNRSCHRCYQARPRLRAPQRQRAWSASCAGASATQLCQAPCAVEPAPAGHAAGKTRRGVVRPPLLSAHTAHTRTCTSYSASTALVLERNTPCACGLVREAAGLSERQQKVCLLVVLPHPGLWVCSRYVALIRQ